MPAESFYSVLNAAIEDLAKHGYDKAERVAYWEERIRRAAEASMTPPDKMKKMIDDAMRSLYRRLIDRKEIVKLHPGISRFTIDKLRPQLHAELSRRLMANANLIVLNKKQAVEKTMQRWVGWATAQPVPGAQAKAQPAAKKVEAKEGIRKSMAGLPFEERRVLIDQGHKMTAALSDIIAQDGGAIAAIWHSHYHQQNYNYREPHKEREIESKKKPYVIRGNWALSAGLMKLDGAKYTDSMTQPAEEIFCRCYWQYIYNLASLPDSMITAKGKESLKAAREAV